MVKKTYTTPENPLKKGHVIYMCILYNFLNKIMPDELFHNFVKTKGVNGPLLKTWDQIATSQEERSF